IRTYALKIILDPQGYLAQNLGINIQYTKYAVGIGLVYNYLPLFILPVFASLERMDWSLIEAATDLGARPFTAFREITLRLTLPGVVTGALLVFIPMTGEFIIPDILSGGNYEFVGNVIGDQFQQAQIGNITVWNGFTSCWFLTGLHDPTYLPAIVVSLQIAALASIISTLLGLGAALALARMRPRVRAPFDVLVYLTLVVPEIVIAV